MDAPVFKPPVVVAPPMPVVPRDATKLPRVALLLGALVIFFLPWLDFRCSSYSALKQSGVQTVAGRYDEQEEVKSLPFWPMVERQVNPKSEETKTTFRKEVGYAWLVGVALLFAGFGLGAAPGPGGRRMAGTMALLALVCLGIQVLAGFPLERRTAKMIEKEMKEGRELVEKELRKNNVPGIDAVLEASDPKKLYTVHYTPWFYTELGLLGLTALIGLTGKRRKEEEERTASVK